MLDKDPDFRWIDCYRVGEKYLYLTLNNVERLDKYLTLTDWKEVYKKYIKGLVFISTRLDKDQIYIDIITKVKMMKSESNTRAHQITVRGFMGALGCKGVEEVRGLDFSRLLGRDYEEGRKVYVFEFQDAVDWWESGTYYTLKYLGMEGLYKGGLPKKMKEPILKLPRLFEEGKEEDNSLEKAWEIIPRFKSQFEGHI